MKEQYPSPRFYGDTPLRGRKGPIASLRQRVGFTLTEVVLAVGVLSLAILALVGLFGPTMGAVKEVVDRSGALAVADQVNAQLLSDEIYTALGLQNNADRFNQFSGQLMTRNGDNVSLRPGSVLYAWKQFNPDRNEVGNASLYLWPTIETDQRRGTNFDLAHLDGPVYLVFLEEGLQQGSNTYDFSKVAQSAYFPIQVSIYEAPMNLISSGNDLQQTDLEPYAKGLRGKPLFQYTTAKLR